ncbi:GlcG/HbpS family heme-binding protein [Novosphingobium sp. 9]|uniref:GlcG/HbpS family heme-binding protein n=1 Tax=Novosphingobium sp. 9 TaxID=2025349 RepID=UPI0021B60BD7|nr:heme-binding protein [Novosphingobium sp. 9]
MPISLLQAQTIVAEVLLKAREMELKPITVAVLDHGASLIAFAREDGSPLLRPQVASGKAATALAMGTSSRKVAEMAAERPSFVAALGAIAPQGILPAAGGVLVVDDAGLAIGAVGVSGDTSDNDEVCALAAIAAAGLTAKA